MSKLAARGEDVKIILRGLLISTPLTITVDQLAKDFRQQEGQDVPFRELGYPTFLKYLESIPDTVTVRYSLDGGCPLVVPVQSKKTSHIESLVHKQKVHPSKRPSRERRPAPWRSPVQAFPPMKSTHYGMNYNSYDVKQRIFLPISLQRRIFTMVHENPKGLPVETIRREFFSTQMLQSYGIQEDCDVYQLLARLGHLLEVSNGIVYPVQDRAPPFRPIIQNSVTDNETSKILTSQTYRFIPAGCEDEIHNVCKQNDTENVDNELIGEISNEDDTDIAEAIYKHLQVNKSVENTCVSSTVSLSFGIEEDSKVIPDSGSLSDDTGTDISASDSNHVGKMMKKNFQSLLEKHPSGIWCSDLPDLYKKEFAVVLDYDTLGFASILHMASNLPDVFHCIRSDGPDWKLFDARKKLPPHSSAYDLKCNNIVSTKMVPTVPSKVTLNIKELVTNYPSGICSEQIPHLYKEEFLTTLNVQEMGFDSLEAFLLFLHDSVLHLRYVHKKILVYPLAHETEPENINPLPHITEPQNHYKNMYPAEVVGPKGTLTYEKIPPETAPGGFLEVLVAEIYTPQNFWVQLRGENTHMALDRLMNDMQVFYEQEADNYKMPVPTVRIGQYCVAPYSEEWHRACITAVHNFVDVQILFVDYGTTFRIKKSELRFLHSDFATFPIQAIKSSLVNLVPCGGGKKWPRETSTRFLELVSEKNLVALVSSVYHEARKLEVCLVDTSGVEDIHINDVLVCEGLAEYKTNRPPSPLPTQPKRIDMDPVSSTITVSRPPPGFTATSDLQYHNQPLLSPTGLAAPGQSSYVPEIQGKSHVQLSQQNFAMGNTILSKTVCGPEKQVQTHPLTSLPTLPIANTIPSNFIPQPTDVPLLANSSSLVAQSSVLQQLALYEHFWQQQQQQLMRFAFLVSQNISAASLVNPFVMPMLNPPMMYTPTPVSERIINVPQSELDISEVLCTPSMQKNASEQISPSDTGHIAVAANGSTEDSESKPATSSTHTTTKESQPAISSDVSDLSANVNSSPEISAVDIPCDEEHTEEVTESPTKETPAGHKGLNNTPYAESFCGVDQTDAAEAQMLESESNVDLESEDLNEVPQPDADLSLSSDEIYRSDAEDDDEEGIGKEDGEGVFEQPKQSSLRTSKYVKQIEIAGRVIHLVTTLNTVFICTDEVVRHFTSFSGRHIILKILDSRGIKIPFCEIERKNSPAIIDELQSYNVVGVPKSPDGYIIGKIHLTPLTSVTHLIPLLNVEHQEEFRSVVSVQT